MTIKIFNPKTSQIEEVEKIFKSDDEWEKILTPEEFRITRKKGTEPPFANTCPVPRGKDGIYVCVCCGTSLFKYSTKFDSGTGWPSFFEPISKLNISEVDNSSYGDYRVEVSCARCGAHLGHVFPDGPPPTHKRFCINTIALKLEK